MELEGEIMGRFSSGFNLTYKRHALRLKISLLLEKTALAFTVRMALKPF